MARRGIIDTLRAYGEKHFHDGDPAHTLSSLHQPTDAGGAGMTISEIAKLLGCSVDSVRYAFKRLGVSARRGQTETFTDRVRAQGFESVEEFFLKYATLTFGEMAGLVGLSAGTIERYYHEFARAF